MKRQRRQKTWARTAGLAILLFLVVILLSTVPLVRDWQVRFADTFFRLAPAPDARSKVIIVTIDDESLQRYGRWPWSRTQLARLTNSLAQDGASVIGLDILLSEPQAPAADKALQDAILAAHAVIVDKIASYPEGPQWMEPLPLFAQAAGAIGHAQAPLDADSVCRRYPARELTLDGSRWAFGVEVARQVDAQATSRFLAGYGIADKNEQTSVVTASPILIPIFYRRGGFDTISAKTVLEGVDPAAIRNRPVLVGFGTTEIGDRLSTPLHPEFPTPGVEVHAQIVDSILSGRVLHSFPIWVEGLLLLLTCTLAAAVFQTWRGLAAVGVFAVMTVAVYAVAFLVFVLGSKTLPAGAMMLSVALAPLLVYTADFVLVERSVTQQLLGLRSWLAQHGKGGATREREDLSWRLGLLQQLQTELGSLYELHSALLESTQDLVAIFDERGSLLLKNRAFADAFGLDSNSTLTFDQTRSRWELGENKDGSSTGSGEHEVSLNGELYSVRIATLPATNLSPMGGTIVTLTNLRTRVERDRARAESLGFITHELRTPLASIQGFAELMMSYPDSPVCEAAPETIFRESKRLLALISSYLDVLRLDAGAKAVTTVRVELAEIVVQVFDILRPLANAAGMQLVFDREEGVSVMGDGPLISGAVLNLVSNAIKYGQPGGDIRVRCFRDNKEVIISVHNLGQPVDPEELTRLFDPYFRASNAGKSKTGWGLGLAFVRRIAEKHGGSVRANSTGSGTTFEIRLPTQMEMAMVAKETQ